LILKYQKRTLLDYLRRWFHGASKLFGESCKSVLCASVG